jgi:predicted membrane channel-forming protein YqfA (hemolysin III family)
VLYEGGYTYSNFLVNVLSIFVFIVWFWLLITVLGDLFRRHDTSGLAKVLWVIFLVVLPYIGIFAYLLTQGGGMAERNQAREKAAREELRQVIGFSVSDELTKLEQLKAKGSISEQEFGRLRAKLVH